MNEDEFIQEHFDPLDKGLYGCKHCVNRFLPKWRLESHYAREHHPDFIVRDLAQRLSRVEDALERYAL